MSEFEKELLNKVSPHDRTHNGNELFLGGVLAEHFKDWQPPKKLVVVPQFVSDWFDINQDDIDGNIKALTRNIYRKLKSEWTEMDRWFMYSPNKPIETLIRMKLGGYTVKKEKKEKKYILKHIDLSKSSADDSLYLAHGIYKRLLHARYSKDVDMSKVEECHFIQSEIDKLNIGSYEQIEVEE